jgi:hypothetical protein
VLRTERIIEGVVERGEWRKTEGARMDRLLPLP